MIILALDIAVIAIVVFCGWRGYRNGLIRGVFGIVSIVVSLFIASVAATAYSGDLEEMLNPFIGGIIDSAIVDIFEKDSEIDADGLKDETKTFSTAYEALRRIGLPEAAADRVAEMVAKDNDQEELSAGLLSNAIADRLSSVLSFVAVFGIAFALVAIIFTVIGNLVGFVFSLPGLELLDIISGTLFGLAKGLIIVFAIAAVVRYAGVLAPETFEGTKILKYIVNTNPIANSMGI